MKNMYESYFGSKYGSASSSKSKHLLETEDLLKPRFKGSNRVENSPFRRIPAVRKFVITPGEHNSLLRGSGMDRKLQAQIEVDLEKTNEALNRSLEKTVRRLRNYLENGKTEEF